MATYDAMPVPKSYSDDEEGFFDGLSETIVDRPLTAVAAAAAAGAGATLLAEYLLDA